MTGFSLAISALGVSSSTVLTRGVCRSEGGPGWDGVEEGAG